MKPTITHIGEFNINRFAEAFARALTAQYEKQYPGLQITIKNIRKKNDGDTANKGSDNSKNAVGAA